MNHLYFETGSKSRTLFYCEGGQDLSVIRSVVSAGAGQYAMRAHPVSYS
jgi:hypothetical protein